MKEDKIVARDVTHIKIAKGKSGKLKVIGRRESHMQVERAYLVVYNEARTVMFWDKENYPKGDTTITLSNNKKGFAIVYLGHATVCKPEDVVIINVEWPVRETPEITVRAQ